MAVLVCFVLWCVSLHLRERLSTLTSKCSATAISHSVQDQVFIKFICTHTTHTKRYERLEPVYLSGRLELPVIIIIMMRH